MENKNMMVTLCFLAAILFGCEKHDPVDDWARIGSVTPTTYWEIPSTTIVAGNNVTFSAQFYSSENVPIDHMETWYDVSEHITLEATCPNVTFVYTKNVETTSLVREFQKITSYEFNEEYWNEEKRAYVVTSSFPTSNTLKTVEWIEAVEFDQEKYTSLFPDTFATAFQRDLYIELEKNEKFSDLRMLMVGLGIMETEEFKNITDSTFNDNKNDWEYFIKETAKEQVKEKYFAIPFDKLIYDTSNMVYKLNYQKSYILNANYKVFDKQGNVGTAEKKVIDLI